MPDLPIQPDEERRKAPQPLTEEQLDFFTEQTVHAVRRTMRKTLRNAFIGYLVLFAGTLGVYWNGQHVSSDERESDTRSGTIVAVAGCNRDYEGQERFIRLLERLWDANRTSFKAGIVSAEQYASAQALYRFEIRQATMDLPDCRDAEATFEDDNTSTIPEPRCPGDDRDG